MGSTRDPGESPPGLWGRYPQARAPFPAAFKTAPEAPSWRRGQEAYRKIVKRSQEDLRAVIANEAKQSMRRCGSWMAWSLTLLAMTAASYRFTSQVVVPSLLSLSAMPMAASSPRMRSDSFQFFAARAVRRLAINSSIVGPLPLSASL